jgi:hypothetical protein
MRRLGEINLLQSSVLDILEILLETTGLQGQDTPYMIHPFECFWRQLHSNIVYFTTVGIKNMADRLTCELGPEFSLLTFQS